MLILEKPCHIFDEICHGVIAEESGHTDGLAIIKNHDSLQRVIQCNPDLFQSRCISSHRTVYRLELLGCGHFSFDFHWSSLLVFGSRIDIC